jgi:uncharacterized protein (TIGR02145 family)
MNHLFKSMVILLVISPIIYLTSCEEQPTIPAVTTATVSAITQTSASTGGNVTGDGGAKVTARGVCWNTTGNPDTGDNKSSDGTGTGTFTSYLTPLSIGTTYYIRAYATNEAGTAYGNELSFTTDPVLLAALTTTSASSITTNSAVSGGNITNNGGGQITERGVCWATSENPTTADSKTSDGTGTGSFTSNLTGLSPSTTYYIRAYAVNSAGTSYGNQVYFNTNAESNAIVFNPELTYGEVTDIDGNVYKTITITVPDKSKAEQIWMAENLKTTKYNNGTDIPLVTGNSEWTALSSPAYCWYDNDENANRDIYGALYNWFAVNTGNLCPDGWHVPTIDEWETLTGNPGYDNTFSDKMREVGAAHWITPNDAATNETGFTALPAGYRNESLGTFGTKGYNAYWWSTTAASGISSWDIEINTNSYVRSYNYQNKYGLSVRCLQD